MFSFYNPLTNNILYLNTINDYIILVTLYNIVMLRNLKLIPNSLFLDE